MTKKRKGLSPLLATVILIGVTVAAGGAVYSMYTGTSSAANSQNMIRVDTATAVKGSNHADFTITVSNVGSNSWKKMEVWIAKEATGRPILYEELHEMAVGKSKDTSADGKLQASEGKTDNSLRAEAIGKNSDGFGVGIGRKFVTSTDDQGTRDVAVAAAGFTAGTTLLTTLDAGFKGAAGDCSLTLKDFSGDEVKDPGCTVFTTGKLSAPLAPGESMRFYADILLSNTLESNSAGTGTKNILDTYTAGQLKPTSVDVGDELVVNIKVVTAEGEETQMQTIVKVIGA